MKNMNYKENESEKSDSIEKLIEQSKYQNHLIGSMLNRFDTIICQLEKISELTCRSLNELHWQTSIQKSLFKDVSWISELLKHTNPEVALRLKELEELKKKLEECCPPEKKDDRICIFEPCLKPPKPSRGSADTKEGASKPQRVKGAPYRPVPRQDNPKFQPNQRPIRIVPQGPFKGLIYESKGSGVKQMGGADDPVVFNRYTINASVAPASANAADISGGDSGRVVMMTGNWYAQYSTDSGQTFNTIDPTTVFPNTLAGGFCCDQVIQYIPSIDRFIWLLQYSQSATGDNAYRIAIASPQDIIDSNCTAWTYWDLTSATFGFGTDWMDYPSLSFGDNFLYMSFDVLDTTADTVADNGLVVVRIPLNELQAGGTINFRFTTPNDSAVAWGSYVSQNTGNEVFWAGHIDNSTIRVFSWHENSTSIFWRSVDVSNWANGTLSSTGPNGNNWFGYGFPNNAIIGITRRLNELWLAWTASNGDGGSGGFNFPHPHVQVVKINIDNYSLIEQMQVWNPDHAFGYPSLATNSNNEVGIGLGWGGGGTLNANSAFGILGDYVVWYRDGSTWTHTRWGDYVSVRQAFHTKGYFSGFGYVILQDTTTTAGHRYDPYYVLFGRKSQAPPPVG